MSAIDTVVQTRLVPPRLPRRWLRRPRLDQLLAQVAEYPLTMVCASAGYGKSSALASFAARGGWPTIWYSIAEGTNDPQSFLAHLVAACRVVVPQVGTRALELILAGTGAWTQALDSLLNDLHQFLDDETILILDDYHLVDDMDDIRPLTERLIQHAPPLLHVLLAARYQPQLRVLPAMHARGELLQFGEDDLAFTDEEIGDLFADVYDHALSDNEAHSVGTQTGGWAIALQLMGQTAGQRDDEDAAAADMSLDEPDVLFAYLAHEVLSQQPPAIQSFLLRSSVLQELDHAACIAVLGRDAVATLRKVERRGLFPDGHHGGMYRYHPLFHAFLQRRAAETLPEWVDLQRRAAAYYRTLGNGERVLYHLQMINDSAGMAEELIVLAPRWIDHGRYLMLLAWLDRIDPATRAASPELLFASGDAYRLLTRFDEALSAYAAAAKLSSGNPGAQSRALRGQALVYLDTVRPIPAAGLLRRAFKLLSEDQRAEKAEILRLIAENRLNSGRPDHASRLYKLADQISPDTSDDDARPRLLLRQGRLNEARAVLETTLPRHSDAAQEKRRQVHREGALMLALVCALQGDVVAAQQYAEAGYQEAKDYGSAFYEAVAHMRIGHAAQIGPTPNDAAANQHYLQTLALADTYHVRRTKAEAYMGLVLLHGFGGSLAAARSAAHEGLAIVDPDGDAWLAGLLWLALGAVGAAAGEAEAATWLAEAEQRFVRGCDILNQMLVYVWQAILHQRRNEIAEAEKLSLKVLNLAQTHGYDDVLVRPALFAPRDRMMLVPVLLAGRTHRTVGSYARNLLARGFPALLADDTIQQYHPGATLRIVLFDRLRVWRGTEEVEPRAWQRKKAQHLLALLLTNRHRWILRDQICDLLWPDDSRNEAETQFKVTLNALNSVLEPARPPRTPPFYIRRQGSAYRFAPSDGVWMDVEMFERNLNSAHEHINTGGEDNLAEAQAELMEAVELYGGEYLSDSLYEDWAREERERLAARYLDAATTLADLFIRQNRTGEAIRLAEATLLRDPSWEDAYRLLMRAYARQGNRRMAIATYERCVRNLRTHLDVAPLPQTIRVYEDIRG